MTGAAARDLDEILDAAADDLRHFAGARVYVTGGTGFIGTWLLRTIAHANRRLGTKLRVEALTRSPESVRAREPELAADAAIRFVRGDILAPVADGAYDAVIHAATPSTAARGETQPERLLKLIVDGTRALIDAVIAPSGAVPVLFTSSGAVYGKQPGDLERLSETYGGGPDCLDPRSAYSEGKRVAELALALAGARGAGRPRVARLFAFLGPGLPLDAHYAAGNFLRDALSAGPIRIDGDGTPYRSYLYPTDLVAWSLAVFARGSDARPYNVGSDEAISIRDLAARIAIQGEPAARVDVAREPEPGSIAERYVPETARIAAELQVRRTIGLDEAIRRTLAFHREARTERRRGATAAESSG